MDSISVLRRSANMRQIRSEDTAPELVVRRLLHRMGVRFRLHVAGLPGRPDIVLKRFHCVVEVRGCFWHQHASCADCHTPKTRLEYWQPKLARTRLRDAANLRKLRRQGWRVLVLWECQTKDQSRLAGRLERFLAGT